MTVMPLYQMAHQQMPSILSVTPITIKYCVLIFYKALMGSSIRFQLFFTKVSILINIIR